MPLTFLALSSYYKGSRFLEAAADAGHTVYLLTVEKLLGERWPRHKLTDVFAVPNFHDRRKLTNAVAYLMRSRRIDRIVALDDFDIEVAGSLREHFRLTHVGHGDSTARLFRDKLAMRTRAAELGVRQPQFTGTANHDMVRDFLARVPGPWLMKPRGEASAAGIHTCPDADSVWRRLDKLGDDQTWHLIEQMVPGELYHVDSLVRQGRVIFAEVNQYWKPLLDVYQGGGVYATRTVPRDRPIVPTLTECNRQVLEGFGLGQGASHTEFMVAHADGLPYFIETSARVGGAETATMVEHAAGPNLWAEWAELEADRTEGNYTLPATKQRYAGVVMSLCRYEHPDTSSFTDPEIVHRVDLKSHIGFVVAADTPDRVEQLLTDYTGRIQRDFHAALPAPENLRE
jgi:phosphoribosylamine-glycine ligase